MSFKELKIKTNVVKRITKEQISYAKELESQQKRVDKLISEGADEADVRKQKEVLEETVQMIPDVKRRLDTAYQELSTMVADPKYAGSEELEEAQRVLEEIQ